MFPPLSKLKKFARFAAFFSAAATLSGTANFVSAETIDEDTAVKNLNEDSPDFSISSGATLSVFQNFDGEYSGTISGAGTLEKYGDGALVFSGTLSSFSASINVYEGVFIVADGFSISGSAAEIYSETAVSLSIEGDVDASLLTISGSGTVEKSGSGTITIGGISGGELRISAGTLVSAGDISVETTYVSENAELCVGNGSASAAAFSTNVVLEGENSTLRFNRESSATALTYSGEISGSGNVIFDGESTTYFTANQTYTGTTTINAGTAIFYGSDDNQIEIASSKIIVNGGRLCGDAILAGDVEINGNNFGSSGTAELGGVLYLGYSDFVLSICGDLKFAEIEVEIVTDSSGNSSYTLTNYGGTTEVYLSESGCGKVEVDGTIYLAGTLILAGSSNLVPGQVEIFMSAGTIEGDFEYVILSSENVMLVSPGIAGVGENEYGIAVIENANLRERSSFVEHEGISSFVDYIASQTSASRPNEIGQIVNLASGKELSRIVNALSPLSHCSLLSLAVRESNLEVDYLRKIFPAGTSGPFSADGISVPGNVQFFSSILMESVYNRELANTPIFDTYSLGVFAGAYRWVDSERLIGASVGIHTGTVKIHGYKSGDFDDYAFRLRLFAGMMPANENWNVIFGVSAAGHFYDIDRETAAGTNSAEEGGLEAGVFAVWQYRDKVVENFFFTPYVRLDVNYIRVDTVRETGSLSALEVDAFGYTSFRGRIGVGIERFFGAGTRREKMFGVDIGFVTEFGKDPRISSSFVNYDGSGTTIRGLVEDRAAFEVTPKFRKKFGRNWTAEIAIKLQVSSSGAFSDAFIFGISTIF